MAEGVILVFDMERWELGLLIIAVILTSGAEAVSNIQSVAKEAHNIPTMVKFWIKCVERYNL